MRKIYFVFAIFFLFAAAYSPAQYRLENAFEKQSFTFPTDVIFHDSRAFVIELKGKIHVFENTSSVTTSKVFLDISDSLDNTNGNGLVSLAFHPNYSSNKYLYLLYSFFNPDTILVLKLSRFTCSSNPDSAIRNSEINLFRVQSVKKKSDHHGGRLLFYGDRTLYISTGDGDRDNTPDTTTGALAQNLTSLFGKLLKINVTVDGSYIIPHSNPFYNNTQGYREEIYAYGFRNLWRFSIDLPTNTIWGSDVGDLAWEEINIIKPGKNYGWNILEGNHCTPFNTCDTTNKIFEKPVFVYPHSAGRSIIGGYAFRGEGLATLRTRYIYADFVFGKIWSYNRDDNFNRLLLDTNIFINSISADLSNNLYFVNYFSGTIERLVHANYDTDVNGDGITDSVDLALVDNDAYNFVTGYVNTDVNGDNQVDSHDLTLVDNFILGNG